MYESSTLLSSNRASVFFPHQNASLERANTGRITIEGRHPEGWVAKEKNREKGAPAIKRQSKHPRQKKSPEDVQGVRRPLHCPFWKHSWPILSQPTLS
jgi:hypothetical protein